MVVAKEPEGNYCWCEECKSKNEWKFADFIVSVGMFRFHLCKEHAWDLSELLDSTTETSFVREEK